MAEHLDASVAERFVHELTDLAPVVLFSAAIPWQKGMHHVNLRWQSYWAKLFADRGYVAVDYVRPQLWADEAVAAAGRHSHAAAAADRPGAEAAEVASADAAAGALRHLNLAPRNETSGQFVVR